MDQQHCKVHEIKVGDGGIEASGHAPGEAHHQVAEVVRMTTASPPSAGNQFSTSLCLHELETLFVLAIAEIVFLTISGAEDVVTREVEKKDQDGIDRTQLNRVEGEITSLESVCEGHPSKVANGKHVAKSVGDNIHGGEDGGLIVHGVKDVPSLEGVDKPHGICDTGDATEADRLFTEQADINECPKDETWAKLVE
jgi:hypothetical protein